MSQLRRRATFWQWLRRQRHRADPVGDLARDVWADREWPRRARRLATLDAYLTRCHACAGAHEALREAVREYEGVRSTFEGRKEGGA